MKTAELVVTPAASDELQQIWRVDKRCFSSPFTLTELSELFVREQTYFWVAKANGRIVGFMIYDREGEVFQILCVGVDRLLRRLGIGRAMVQKLKDLATEQSRAIVAAASDREKFVHLFFSNLGFKAISVTPEIDGPDSPDIYTFEFKSSECGESHHAFGRRDGRRS